MAQGDQFFLASAAGEKVELTGDMSVGRSPECDLVVSEGQPSRQHARITVDDTGVSVEDLGSTNGTFVNGSRLTAKHLLSDGDEIAFDINKFQLEVKSPAPPADATVLRQIEDPNRTVLRPMPPKVPKAEEPAPVAQAPEPAPAAAPAGAAEAAPPAPEPVQAAVPPPAYPTPTPSAPPAAAKPVKPGSWADPNEKNSASTQFFSPADLAAMRGATIQEKVESDVPLLQIASGSAAGSVIKLIPEGDKKEWTIGKAEGRDILFNDQGVSDFHTILVHESGRWKVVDQMSTNGTYVNGAKTVSGYLNSGDKIRIGTVECTFMLPGGAGAKKAAKRSGEGGNSKTIIAAVSFVVVLAVMFGAYFFFM